MRQAPIAQGERVFLRHPAREDAEEFLAMVAESAELHRPWVYPPDCEEAFRASVDRSCTDRNFRCLICRGDSQAIVGSASLTEIVGGLFQSAYLAFYGHARYSGRGFVKEGVGLLLRHAFTKMDLHRVEANVQPANEASRGLIESLGFAREGYSPKYLKIGGKWRDHERWALLVEHWHDPGRDCD